MPSSIAIPAGSPATPYPRSLKRTSSFTNSTSLSSPSSPPPSAGNPKALHIHRPSFLSSAISQQECTVINIGGLDGPPWLIFYLSSSQGFVWNPEIFLPSYIDCGYVPPENHRDHIH
ncbi:hypothetical protein B0J15DRAFT_515497 [Fusarium solani]|uniref:Uncharacterized protein n=1 Tax=Fusarium solani TaxID=169388 RepID=A0A9P9GSD2_FUSSL|nr:uncharacterized protein B0J15DRAFT_515497 [Fusarium solani]KAH7243848.1 hypothetical protein B0J15DRAFT_515497 [Fusarium solani]